MTEATEKKTPRVTRKKAETGSSAKQTTSRKKSTRASASSKSGKKSASSKKTESHTEPICTPFDDLSMPSNIHQSDKEVPQSPVLDRISSGISNMQQNLTKNIAQRVHAAESNSGIEITNHLLGRIIEMSIDEVYGVERARNNGFAWFTNLITGRVNGIKIEKGVTEVAVDMTVRVHFGEDIRILTSKLRDVVERRILQMTGMKVVEVNIHIQDVNLVKPAETDE
ncbi:MAG TPA: Asp23/Gls24 family envelope stress response protein [Firmicutes bacterium]|nr:Asp23/Gls24 family envelope stress response protein [Bacillota bacterium]